MLVAALPPAVVNPPPAYTSLPDTASADTKGPLRPPLIPEPSADQLLPSHLAMSFAALPPAERKSPPAYTSLPDTASADTEKLATNPEPNADQLLPFHLAMLTAALPPAVVNLPLPDTPPIDTASADTKGPLRPPLIPEPSAVQLLP